MRPLALGLLAVWLLPSLAIGAEIVQFTTDDGFTIHGDLTRAESDTAPVAILLHMYRSDRNAWSPLIPALADAGFHVLAIDQRTHGDSTQRGEEMHKVEGISRPDFRQVVRRGPLDVVAAYRFLREQGIPGEKLALIGASYGCTVSLLTARDLPGIDALVLLSPGTRYFGVPVVEVARFYKVPMLAVAAEDDRESAESARALIEAHDGQEKLVIYPKGGHGTRLFAPHPELGDTIVAFLNESLGLVAETPPPPGESPEPSP